MIKDILKIIVLTLLFSIFIFFINYAFFWESKSELEMDLIEQRYIDPDLWWDFSLLNEQNYSANDVMDRYKKLSIDEQRKTIEELRKQIIKENKKSKEDIQRQLFLQEKDINKFKFIYIPSDIKNQIFDISTNIYKALKSDIFDSKINSLIVEFYEQRFDTRWKMKNKTIKLFDPLQMWEIESFTVFIHELWHIVDLYFLENNNFDYSNLFYNISWESTSVIKSGQNQEDFVSGYAMTNKYEDFAETFTYFVLHNDDFLEKTNKSLIIKDKYDFFANYIFKDKDFIKTDFSLENKTTYFWDTTKLDIKLENFLQYIEK